MASYTNIFTPEELTYLANLPEVLEAQGRLQTNGRVYFSVSLPDSIKATLRDRLGLDLSSVSNVPMRWISGETHPHVDVGPAHFTNTYLAYITDSAGEFVLDGVSYPISANTAYVFNEGLSHETRNTGTAPRLMLGPMSEGGVPVGGFAISYYPTQADALATTNTYGSSPDVTVGNGGPFGPGSGYTQWRIASNSGGTSSQVPVYNNGDTLNNDGNYNMYPAYPCFLEGSQILCSVDGVEKYVAVEELKKGTLVKTRGHGFKAVELIGSGVIANPGDDARTENRLYRCSTRMYPELKSDLFITGAHSILVKELTGKERAQTVKQLGRVFITGDRYRLMACLDARAEPWNAKGTFPIRHFALENVDEGHNYGVYANGGLLVETCSIKFLKTKTNMKILS
jgi:hypothetical protein